MRVNTIVSIVLISLTVIWVGYGLIRTSGSNADVQAKLDELTPANEKTAIDVNILSGKSLKDLESLKVFGKRPVGADAGSLNRPNPFEGI